MSTLDLDKIDSFREMDQKDSKAALATYAATFGVKLNKQKSFDNMLLDLVEEVPAPKPEKPDVDLDTPVFVDPNRNLEEEDEVSLMVAPVVPVEEQKSIGELFNEFEMVSERTPEQIRELNTPKVKLNGEWTVEIDQSGFDDDGVTTVLHGEEADEELRKIIAAQQPAGEYQLPEHFSPTIILMGAGGSRKGFCTLPYWIFDWINQNPNWKDDPDACLHFSARDTLRSLIYFIRRDGDVTIRETRNSSYHTLK